MPYKEPGGAISRGALRAILAVLAGARGGVSIPNRSAVQAKVERLAKQAGIDTNK